MCSASSRGLARVGVEEDVVAFGADGDVGAEAVACLALDDVLAQPFEHTAGAVLRRRSR